MKYTYKYFKESMPEWKRKKDPLIGRFFLRPVSFYISAFAANHNISANTVSYFSMFVGLIGCLLFYFNNYYVAIIGALLMLFWSILDCVDGNLARSIKKQPFGEFADGISGYWLVAFMGTALGYYVYLNGGIFTEIHNSWSIVIGSVSSVFDILVRLTYQKYKTTENILVKEKIISVEIDEHRDHSKVGSFKIRFEQAGGIGGWLTILILLGTIFNALDLVILYCFLYFGASFIGGSTIYIKKAMEKGKIDISQTRDGKESQQEC